ncbi:MAG: DNA repair protein RecN [Myxococcota bacterium]
MLSLLRVRNLAIIDELEVEFGRGLNVVTGETGAGKSILVTALQLVLGGRGRADIVRTGAKYAEVEALFEVGDDPALRAQLAAAELEAGDELLIRRRVQESGRTRAFINGRLATQAQLTMLASGLADISSQHEHHSLVDPSSHLEYLDAFAKLGKPRTRVAKAHALWSEAAQALETLAQAIRERADREDLLRFQVQEIDELAPAAGELESLEEEAARLRHAEQLARAAGSAEETIYAADGSLSEVLSRVATEIHEAAALDASLTDPAKRLDEALLQLEDVASDLGRYARDVRVDPARLADVDDRMDRLRRAVRKFGGSIESVLAHRDNAAEELEHLARHEEHLADAQEALKVAREEAEKAARELSKRRQKASGTLGRRISEELSTLGMGGAQVVVELARLESRGGLEIDGARLSATGIDRAEFLIAPNKGERARPLAKVASGGELSRAMLAIKRTLAGLGSQGTYVFDEVDSGVGGAVAEVIGRKLADVAKHHQVICITHLAQIAAYGDAHYRVSKREVGKRTQSDIALLSESDRLEEVARMVGGVTITARTRAAAAELIEQASGARE